MARAQRWSASRLRRWRRVRVDVIASHQQHGLRLQRGQRVLVLHPSGLEFTFSLLACFKLGIIAVPAYPPLPQRLAADLTKLEALMASCTPAAVLTTAQYIRLRQVSSLRHVWPGKSIPWHATDVWRMPRTPANTGSLLGALRSALQHLLLSGL
jgi:acyl-CoA synthetase (AMP-forming)/AMP-acid ligase II